MHIDQANLTNLTSLWKKYGAREIKRNMLPLLYASTDWPNRCWLDWGALSVDDLDQVLQETDKTWIKNVPESKILALWAVTSGNQNRHAGLLKQELIEKFLLEKNCKCLFEQTAMYLPLQDAIESPQVHPEFQVKAVSTAQEITKWVDISSEAFAYSIDRSVIEKLLNEQDIQLLIGWKNDLAIASALLYKTGDIIGVHQLGIKQDFQGKGFARCLMLEIIRLCYLWQGRYLVLQASQAGKPLYDSLGFTEQFLIKNYQIN
jgi:ribosomal protein S18 acetylase RimI-like enzyme